MPSSTPPLQSAVARERWRARAQAWLPWVVWAVAVIAEVLTGSDTRLGPVLAAVPPLVAVAHGWRAVLVSGLAATLTQQAFLYVVEAAETGTWTTAMTAMSGVTLASALSAAARVRRERQVQELHDVVGGMQRALLHPLPPELGGYRIAGFYQAAHSDARVGGDFYEALETPYGLRVVLGDVSGKGLPAVDATVTLLGAFREAAYEEADLGRVALVMDRALRRRQRISEDHRFATALIVEAGADGRLRMVNCGHVRPHLVDARGAREVALPTYGLLGLFHLVPKGLPEPVAHTLAPGESLLVVTDGVTEARGERRDFFDLAAFLTGPAPRQSPVALKEALLDALARHTRGHLSDDAAALVLTPGEGGVTRAGGTDAHQEG
ncbi:PP2C family protein-serine/threonine phosphatase [Streptomyces sp. NPDC088745]|uniref:PP2C family protein-serine/threonine phosphatase n=1 Tax=Streptomyces sp. NPDC088745 TaxID=3365884 RepID=UPI0037F5F089